MSHCGSYKSSPLRLQALGLQTLAWSVITNENLNRKDLVFITEIWEEDKKEDHI